MTDTEQIAPDPMRKMLLQLFLNDLLQTMKRDPEEAIRKLEGAMEKLYHDD